LSPIATPRRVAAALDRARAAGRAGGVGGLSLDSMPGPEHLGPLGAHLVADDFGWCTGQVVFASGPETAIVDQPRLMEVVRTSGVASIGAVLSAFIPRAMAKAEGQQASAGGSNPRFGGIFNAPVPEPVPSPTAKSCIVVGDRPALVTPLIAVLEARSISCRRATAGHGFSGAADALRAAIDDQWPIDAVVVALDGQQRPAPAADDWASILSDHGGITDHLHADASWARATADYATQADRPVRLVTLTDATSPSGRTRAQSAVQLARALPSGTGGHVTAFAAGIEAPDADAAPVVAELVGHLLADPDAAGLAGAELAVGPGWLGLRSHPRPIGSVTYGGPALPAWLDDVLKEIVGTAAVDRKDAP
ncbi:MAG TPA: hypothetical protein VIY26_03125, partial [Acidimicrobiales bacterium]